MKVLILVENVAQVPARFKNNLLVITQSNWEETFHYLEGKRTSVHAFLHENAPFERLLKLVEDYKGDIALYTSTKVDPVFLPRFTRVINRRPPKIDPHFGEPSENAKRVQTILNAVI